VTKGAILRSPGTKYKRSKNAFAFTSVALTLVSLGTKLLETSAHFLIGSPGTRSGTQVKLPFETTFFPGRSVEGSVAGKHAGPVGGGGGGGGNKGGRGGGKQKSFRVPK